jgi:hypothetical protein
MLCIYLRYASRSDIALGLIRETRLTLFWFSIQTLEMKLGLKERNPKTPRPPIDDE